MGGRGGPVADALIGQGSELVSADVKELLEITLPRPLPLLYGQLPMVSGIQHPVLNAQGADFLAFD